MQKKRKHNGSMLFLCENLFCCTHGILDVSKLVKLMALFLVYIGGLWQELVLINFSSLSDLPFHLQIYGANVSGSLLSQVAELEQRLKKMEDLIGKDSPKMVYFV